MVTKTEPKRRAIVVKQPVELSPHEKATLGQLLGMGPRDRGATLELLQELLAENQTCLRGAPLMPTRANHVAAFAMVQKDAERLYRTITDLAEHHRSMLPDASTFVDQLAKFHDDVQIGLIQMRGRGSARGGGKRQGVAAARQMVEHSLGMFFDLNALAPNGTLRSERLSRSVFVQERQHFIEYCMGLIELLTA